jgi:hypothetical protein
MPVPQRKNQFSCGAGILPARKRLIWAEPRKQLIYSRRKKEEGRRKKEEAIK